MPFHLLQLYENVYHFFRQPRIILVTFFIIPEEHTKGVTQEHLKTVLFTLRIY